MILIDDRAGSKDLVHHKPLSDPSLARLRRLDSGDVMFSGQGPEGPVLVGVELKSFSDLLSSLSDNRLPATQIPGLLDTYDISYLLWYGFDRPSPLSQKLEVLKCRVKTRGKWRWKLAESSDLGAKKLKWYPATIGKGREVPYGYLHNFLSLLPLVGVHPVQVGGVKDAASWVAWAYHLYQKPWSEHSSFRCFDESSPIPKRPSGGLLVPDLPPEIRQAAECAKATLPGIGYQTAVRAAEHFAGKNGGLPPVAKMVRASSGEWREVDGIGKVLGDMAARTFGNR